MGVLVQHLREEGRSRLLVLGWVLVPIIFAIDLEIPRGYAGGMPYVVPVVLGLWASTTRYVWAVATVATLLTVLGFYLPSDVDPFPRTVYVNRAAAIAAVWITALVVARETRTKRRLRTAEARLAEAQRTAHIGSLDGDLESGAIWASVEARRLLGLEGEQLTPARLLQRVLPSDRERIQREVMAALRDDAPVRVQVRIEPAPGTIRVVQVNGKPMPGARGRPPRLIGTLQDISEQKRLEEELLHAQKLEAVGRLAAGVGHDVNNVLMGVNGCIDAAISKLGAESPAHPFLLEAKKSAASGASVVRQLVSYGRKSATEDTELELDALIGESEQMLRRLLGEAVRLRMHLGAYGGFVCCDSAQLQQVLMNLIVNARDAMPEGGTVTVQTAEVTLGPSDTRRYPSLEPGKYITLHVADTGAGMDEPTRARAFEPFFTTKELGRGTGLGLSTTHSIIERVKGHIEVESEVGVGTTFRIFFPRVIGSERTKPEAPRAQPIVGRGEHVLVVEDEPLVRRAVAQYLERRGYRVCLAADAEAALELFRVGKGSIDVVLTDIVLPGMSGLRLAALLRRDAPAQRIVLMSANTDTIPEDSETPSDVPLLHKPFTEEELAATLHHMLMDVPSEAASGTILLIEDNDATRDATAELLSDSGYRVLAARNGAEARALCARHGREIGLLLADLGLPDVSGHALVAELRQTLPNVGVIYVSGRPRDDALVREILTEPTTEYLQKPVDFDEIALSVSRLLH